MALDPHPSFEGCRLTEATAALPTSFTLDYSSYWELRISDDLHTPYTGTEAFTASGSVTADRAAWIQPDSDIGLNHFAFGVNECFCFTCAIPTGNGLDPDGPSYFASGDITGTDVITPDGGGPTSYPVSGTVKIAFGFKVTPNFPYPDVVDYTKALLVAFVIIYETIGGVTEEAGTVAATKEIAVTCKTWAELNEGDSTTLDLFRDPTGGPGGGYGDAFLDLPGSHPIGWLQWASAATFTWS